jgi:prepilin-type processing-associated H-X9-DG protein
MNASTGYAQTSRFAQKSQFLGVLSLLLLLLCGFLVFAGIHQAWTGVPVWRRGPISISRLADICAGLAGLAALAALVLGILGLAAIRQGAGKVKGTSQAVSGLVTASLTLLSLMLVLGMYVLGVPGDEKRESSNNLKELGLAMHRYHESYNHFPPAVVRDPALGDGGRPYSWRVALLPYLGEYALFSQYRRDEPWDSKANRAVLARMPPVFAVPGDVRAADGFTHYQVLVGPGTAFERPDLKVRLTDFLPRGPSEIILVVEAADPVPWTKPQDLPYDPAGPLPKVGGLVGNGFHALFADGSVRWIEAKQQEDELRTHVPRNGP